MPVLATLARSAVDNARRAAFDLSTAVRDRAALQPPDDVDPAPGVLATLPRADALALLAAHQVGRFCYVARAGVPDVVPVNYVLDGDRLLARSGPGPKLQAAERGDVVAVEVDEIDETTHSGLSVVVVGPARVLSGAEVAALPVGPQAWADGPRRHVLAVQLRRVTGRRLG